jgi:hypothetical protein
MIGWCHHLIANNQIGACGSAAKLRIAVTDSRNGKIRNSISIREAAEMRYQLSDMKWANGTQRHKPELDGSSVKSDCVMGLRHVARIAR